MRVNNIYSSFKQSKQCGISSMIFFFGRKRFFFSVWKSTNCVIDDCGIRRFVVGMPCFSSQLNAWNYFFRFSFKFLLFSISRVFFSTFISSCNFNSFLCSKVPIIKWATVNQQNKCSPISLRQTHISGI